MKDDLLDHNLPIAFWFSVASRSFLLPLAGDADTQCAEAELSFIRDYLHSERLRKITYNQQRVLRVLDFYAQRHLRTHFITSSLCSSTLRDVRILQWVLDPDANHNIACLLTHSQQDTPSDLPDEQKAQSDVDELFALFRVTCPSVKTLWSEPDPEEGLLAHLSGFVALHVGQRRHDSAVERSRGTGTPLPAVRLHARRDETRAAAGTHGHHRADRGQRGAAAEQARHRGADGPDREGGARAGGTPLPPVESEAGVRRAVRRAEADRREVAAAAQLLRARAEGAEERKA